MSCPCYRCGKDLLGNAFGRSDRCPACGVDARCCRNCAFEEPSYRSECRETQAEPVRDRESANYCDYFRPRSGPAASAGPRKDAGSRTAFEALFRKPPPP
jgi:hypothetical protein